MVFSFLRRSFPNANSVLLHGARPVLVDAGAPGGEAELLQWLADCPPALLVNTHWHSDHTGGNHALAAQGVPIAAARPDAAAVNARHPDACRSRWLSQHVPSYTVSHLLEPGDVMETGTASWQVIALPGHTQAQIGLFHEGSRTLVAGDAIHGNDVGWLDLDANPDALQHVETTIDAIAALAPTCLLSGHGPAVSDVPAALQSARRRVASWRAHPERIAWHACKRIFGHLLYTESGLDRARLEPTLLDAPWFIDHARRAFRTPPSAFVPMLVNEMVRSGAASWTGDRLVPGAPPG